MYSFRNCFHRATKRTIAICPRRTSPQNIQAMTMPKNARNESRMESYIPPSFLDGWRQWECNGRSILEVGYRNVQQSTILVQFLGITVRIGGSSFLPRQKTHGDRYADQKSCNSRQKSTSLHLIIHDFLLCILPIDPIVAIFGSEWYGLGIALTCKTEKGKKWGTNFCRFWRFSLNIFSTNRSLRSNHSMSTSHQKIFGLLFSIKTIKILLE